MLCRYQEKFVVGTMNVINFKVVIINVLYPPRPISQKHDWRVCSVHQLVQIINIHLQAARPRRVTQLNGKPSTAHF